MGTKELFEKSEQADVPVSKEDVVNEGAESTEYLDAVEEQGQRVFLDVDYSEPENFVRFGLAEEYYRNAIDRIINTYPYDGSEAEKTEWRNRSTDLDLWIFDNEYPKYKGYFDFREVDTGFPLLQYNSFDFFSTPAFVQYDGGMSVGDVESGESYAESFDDRIKYDDEYLDGALNFDIADKGVTFETWYSHHSESPAQYCALFDCTNGEPQDVAEYRRLSVGKAGPFLFVSYDDGTASTDFAPIQIPSDVVEEITGSAGEGPGTNYECAHYAVSISPSDGSNSTVKAYVNGQFVGDATINTTNIQNFSESNMTASIGALAREPQGSLESNPPPGLGGANSTFDEVRLWKKERTDKEIYQNWRQAVHGGTNTDDANIDLALYYKFNEGNIGDDTDENVLDYSGRVNNGYMPFLQTILNQGDPNPRQSGSMLEDCGFDEEGTPIIYRQHPDVSTFYDEWVEKGDYYDSSNSRNLYERMPAWILQDDGFDGELKKLVQIIASYLDYLYLQIENLNDVKSADAKEWKFNPLPFSARLLEEMGMEAAPIFDDIEIIEKIASTDEGQIFEDSVEDIKNQIYQNIYNNIDKIYKSKGTLNSVRNLLRCYGVDENIIDINVYGDRYEKKLESVYQDIDYKKNYIDFYNPVYKDTSVTSLGDIDFGDVFNTTDFTIPDNITNNAAFIPEITDEYKQAETYTADVQFPNTDNATINGKHELITSSIYGAMSVNDSDPSGSSPSRDVWPTTDNPSNFQILSEKPAQDSKSAKFILTSSVVQEALPRLETEYKPEVYDNSNWKFSVKVFPEKAGYEKDVDGTSDSDFIVEFSGYSYIGEQLKDSFTVTGTVDNQSGKVFVTGSKRAYCGALVEDFNVEYTDNVIYSSDVRVSELSVWKDNISNESLKKTTIDPSRNSTEDLDKSVSSETDFPSAESLVLKWDFERYGIGGTTDRLFIAADASADYKQDNVDYGSFGDAIDRDIYAYVQPFAGNENEEFVSTKFDSISKEQFPEHADPSKFVKNKPSLVEKELRKQKILSLEKGPYNAIDKEVRKWFASVVEYKQLMGQISDKYSTNYKKISKLRGLLFDKFGDDVDVERFIDFYKWVDDSIVEHVEQLMPANMSYDEDVLNTIQSHMLERNKYHHKIPSLDYKEIAFEDDTSGFENKFFSIFGGVNRDVEINLEDEKGILSTDVNYSDREYNSIDADKEENIEEYYKSEAKRIRAKSIWTDAESEVTASKNIELASVDLKEYDTNPYNTDTKRYTFDDVGNYENPYEYFQTAGKSEVKTDLAEETGSPNRTTEKHYRDRQDDFRIYEAYDNVDGSKQVFRVRFSSPGDEYTLSRGYLDYYGGEYSPYTSLLVRNMDVRDILDEDHKDGKYVELSFMQKFSEAEQGRNDGGSEEYSYLNPEYHGTPLNHKVKWLNYERINTSNYNDVYYVSNPFNPYNGTKLNVSNADVKISGDNYFVTHAIPSIYTRYAWINNIRLEYDKTFGTYTYHIRHFDYLEGDNDDYLLDGQEISPSDKKVLDTPYTYHSLGSLTMSLDTDNYSIGYKDVGDDPSDLYVMNNKNNGPYGHPTWKQLRATNNPLTRWERENNRIRLELASKTQENTGSNHYEIVKPKNSYRYDEYFEPVLNQFRDNLIVRFIRDGNEYEATYPYALNQQYFANEGLNRHYNIGRCKETASIEKIARLQERFEVTDIEFNNKIYPKYSNRNLVRNIFRSNYDVSSIWAETHEGRITSSYNNIFGTQADDQSVWPLDTALDFGQASALYDGIDAEASFRNTIQGVGELQNTYVKNNLEHRYNRSGLKFEHDGGSIVDNVNNIFEASYLTNDTNISTADYTGNDVIGFSSWLYFDTSDGSASEYGLFSMVNNHFTARMVELENGNVQLIVARRYDGTNYIWYTEPSVSVIEKDSWEHVGIFHDHGNPGELIVYVTGNQFTDFDGDSEQVGSGSPYYNVHLPDQLVRNFIGVSLPMTQGGSSTLYETDFSNESYWSKSYIDEAAFWIGDTLPNFTQYNNIFVSTIDFTDDIAQTVSQNASSLGLDALRSFYRLGNDRNDRIGYISDFEDATVSPITSDPNMELKWGAINPTVFNETVDPNSQGVVSNIGSTMISRVDVLDQYKVKESNYSNYYARYWDDSSSRAQIQGASGDSNPVYQGVSYINRFRHVYSGDTVYVGDAKWELDGIPYYDDFQELNNYNKAQRREKSLLPEYRQSEFYEKYLEDGFVSQPTSGTLSVIGGAITSSKASGNAFYEDYALSIDLDDYKDIIDGFENENVIISLGVNTVKRFMPYEGFYPVEKTLDLAADFSSSYASSISFDTDREHQTRQDIYDAMFAPGILYNTIKAGIAVDYPVYTRPSENIYSSYLYRDQTYKKYRCHESPYTENSDSNQSRYRFGFDDILNPELSLQNGATAGALDPSSIRDTKAFLGQPESDAYKRSMDTFLGGVQEFFLKDGENTKIVSEPEDVFPNDESGIKITDEEVGDSFVMDVSLRSSDLGSIFEHQVDAYNSYNSLGVGTLYNDSGRSLDDGNYFNYTHRNYTYPESFGKHPTIQLANYNSSTKYSSATYADYTPPHFNGYATMRIVWEPQSAGVYTYEEIFEQADVYNERLTEDALMNSNPVDVSIHRDHEYASLDLPKANSVRNDKMHVSSSVDVFNIEDTSEGKRWVIETKFETPNIDFTDIAEGTDYDSNVDTDITPSGMWLQDGERLGPGTGSYLEISDVPTSETTDLENARRFSPELFTTGSATVEFSGQPTDGDLFSYTGSITERGDNYDIFPIPVRFADGSTFNEQIVVDVSDNSTISETVQETADAINDYTVDNFGAWESPVSASVDEGNSRRLIVHSKVPRAVNEINVEADAGGVFTTGSISGGNLKTIRSLREKIGFSSTSEKIGQVRDTGTRLSELVLVLPFYRQDGERKYIKMDTTSDLTRGEQGLIDDIERYKDEYVFPPELDERDNLLYFPFEFEIDISGNDLVDIWQNKLPQKFDDVEEESGYRQFFITEFPTFREELFDKDMRMMVVKLKKRSNAETYSGEEYDFDKNWPHDYYSVVELADIDFDMELT